MRNNPSFNDGRLPKYRRNVSSKANTVAKRKSPKSHGKTGVEAIRISVSSPIKTAFRAISTLKVMFAPAETIHR